MNCLVWAGGAGRAYPFREVSDHLFRNSPDSFRPLDGEGIRGERAETQVSPDHTVFSFSLVYVMCGCHSARVQKHGDFFVVTGFFCKVWVSWWVTAFVSLPPHHCSCMPAVRVRVGGVRKSWLFLGGWGCYFDCLYLSGVNFQALSSFWACSRLSLVCSSSAFILRKNKLMAGSTMDDRSWAALGCWTCLRYWIWVCGIKGKKWLVTVVFQATELLIITY